MTDRRTLSGLTVKLARVAAGIHQYELAAALGISPQKLSMIENGRLQVSQRYLAYVLRPIESWPTRTAPIPQSAAIPGIQT